MNKLTFYDFEEFVSVVDNVYNEVVSNDEYNAVTIIAKYDDAREIITELIINGYDIGQIHDFCRECVNGYKDEYIITIFENEICIEQAKVDGHYLSVESEVAFVLSDCNSKLLSHIHSDICTFEVEINEEYCEKECHDKECGCNNHCDCKEDMRKDRKKDITCCKDNEQVCCKASQQDTYFVNGKKVSKKRV